MTKATAISSLWHATHLPGVKYTPSPAMRPHARTYPGASLILKSGMRPAVTRPLTKATYVRPATRLPVSHIGFAGKAKLPSLATATYRGGVSAPGVPSIMPGAPTAAAYDPRIGTAYTTDPGLLGTIPGMQGPQALTDPVTGKVKWWVWGIVAVILMYIVKKYIL